MTSSLKQGRKAGISTLGQKFIMALTGLALVGFIIMHLLGNLTLFSPDPSLFNTYVAKLHSFGILLVAAEVGLFLFFSAHIVTGVAQVINHKKARPKSYRMWRSKSRSRTVSGGGGGEDSTVRQPEAQPSNPASRKMAISGAVLLVFLVLHLKQFTFGPGVEAGYATDLNGAQARDLHRLVVEVFKDPMWVAFYVGSMLLLGLHLRHAFWSAFQSLGLMCPRASKLIHCVGLLLAIAVSAGFLFIPLWIFFRAPGGLL